MTLTWLRRQGYRCGIAERFEPHSYRRIDLFGFADIIAFRFNRPGAIAVQLTSAHNLRAHIKKTLLLDAAHEWLAARNRILFVGWLKQSGRWIAQTRELTR